MTSSNIKAMIQCDSYKVWETALVAEYYHTWRSDASKTELIDERQFIEYSPNGYSTTSTVTTVEQHKRWELDVRSSHTKEHWTLVFAFKGSETEIDFAADVTAEKLSIRSTGKSVFEQTYLKKAQTQFITDLKKFLD